MVKKELSIIDIAKQLNISITTVSFVLNGRAKEKRISDELAKKVLKHVEAKAYKPNVFARGLHTGKTNTIGLIVEDISNQFFANVARNIEEYAYHKGYRIVYCSTDNKPKKTKELIYMLKDRHVDGYIITPPPDIEDVIFDMQQNNMPFVLFDRFIPSVNTDYVVVDNFKGAYVGTKHLFEKGYKNIAIITIDSSQSQMTDRLNGYKAAVNEYNNNCIIKKVKYASTPDQSVKEISNFFHTNKQIDGVFFATNYLAAHGLEAANNLNLKISKNLGIVAFDDDQLFKILRPTITAVQQPVKEMAAKVIEILINKLGDLEPPEQKIVFTPTLIERMSTKK
jgi:LacI family transcriptional regulator